jgi:hypothetical protein
MMLTWQAGNLPLLRLSSSAQDWVNHVRYGNTVGLCKTILGRL